ncbi:MAG TPA: hypothetical protein VGH27_07785 [Streptosporangiaceae bacterium]|jgi:hypothetical protein
MNLTSRRKIAAAAAAVTLAGGIGIASAGPAAASAYNCSKGYVSATKAWGTCSSESGGWGGFELTVQCYYWGANTSYGNVPNTIWSTCPSWSHITSISIAPAAF